MTKKEIIFVHLFGVLIGSIFSLFSLKILIKQNGMFSYLFLFPAVCGGGLLGYIIGICFWNATYKNRHN